MVSSVMFISGAVGYVQKGNSFVGLLKEAVCYPSQW